MRSKTQKPKRENLTGSPYIKSKKLQISLSRILSCVIIHLRELPAVGYGHTMWQPICSCSGWSLPSITITSYLVSSYLTISPLPASRRYLFCCTSRKLTLPRCYLAPCPLESGLSSDLESAITFQSVVGLLYIEKLRLSKTIRNCSNL